MPRTSPAGSIGPRFRTREFVGEASTDLNTWGVVESNIIGESAVVTRFYSTENQPKRYFRVRRE